MNEFWGGNGGVHINATQLSNVTSAHQKKLFGSGRAEAKNIHVRQWGLHTPSQTRVFDITSRR